MIFIIFEQILNAVNLFAAFFLGRACSARTAALIPKVSVIIPAYKEGREIYYTISSIINQIYKGRVEIICIVDAIKTTGDYARRAREDVKSNQTLKVIQKVKRGGLVDSRNRGLKMSTGEIVIVMDGDCIADDNMIKNIVRAFADKKVIGATGDLQPLNAYTLLVKLQKIEYRIGIQLNKTGLSKLNMINNIPGAFGAFRKSALLAVNGWTPGTAEDLDLTLKLKAKFPDKKLVHVPEALVYTDVPNTIKGLIKQRLRWEGDQIHIIQRHLFSLFNSNIITFAGLLIHNIYLSIISPILIFIYFNFHLF
jgi:poly-beta-1,6-N-acetyl-D-glucosamine synthase